MNFKVFPIDFLQYLDFPSIIEIRDLQINFNELFAYFLILMDFTKIFGTLLLKSGFNWNANMSVDFTANFIEL